jgi:predicted metal-dependent phosphoesterase TrpH
MPWYQGNLHCHSTNSDGHLSPVEVAEFYRAIGMDFITLSDHNRLTPIAEYADGLSGAVGIPCCEYTGPRSCHVVAVDVERASAPTGDPREWPPLRILQDGIDATLAAGGVPVLCHPCWNWAFGAR